MTTERKSYKDPALLAVKEAFANPPWPNATTDHRSFTTPPFLDVRDESRNPPRELICDGCRKVLECVASAVSLPNEE